MQLIVDTNDVEKFITSEKFTNFLVTNTTDIGTAGFILQTLLDKIDEIKEEEKQQEYKRRNADKNGRWEINPDGYYPYCPFCNREPSDREMTETCGYCGARLEK